MDKLLIGWATFWKSRHLEHSISPAGTTEMFSSELKYKTQIIFSKFKKNFNLEWKQQDKLEQLEEEFNKDQEEN